MEVLEELPAFTAGYAYSLVSNTFVQRSDGKLGTKHLMVLGIPQVVNSMKKHGTSLAAAIVKAVTQLLTQQIALLLQVRGHRSYAEEACCSRAHCSCKLANFFVESRSGHAAFLL